MVWTFHLLLRNPSLIPFNSLETSRTMTQLKMKTTQTVDLLNVANLMTNRESPFWFALYTYTFSFETSQALLNSRAQCHEPFPLLFRIARSSRAHTISSLLFLFWDTESHVEVNSILHTKRERKGKGCGCVCEEAKEKWVFLDVWWKYKFWVLSKRKDSIEHIFQLDLLSRFN